MVNLFGATGYIGSHYAAMYPVIQQARNDLVPQSSCVLYLISTTHNHHAQTNPWIDIDTNIVTMMRVLENCRRQGVQEFNFVSSWFVYGATDVMVDEDSPCRPRGFYSITKHTAEQLMIEYCSMHSIAWRVFRLCNVIGSRDVSANVNKNAVVNVIADVKAGRPVTLLNQGKFQRDYLHVNDVCRAMNHVINTGITNQIFNVGTGTSVAFGDVVRYIISQHGTNVELHDQYGHTVDCLMRCDRVRDLGWYPTQIWQDIVADMVHNHDDRNL